MCDHKKVKALSKEGYIFRSKNTDELVAPITL